MIKLLLVNNELCSGCGTCVVACMDQNDLDTLTQPALRRIIQMESGKYPDIKITYTSAGCMHCQESPCLKACPTNAISKQEQTGAILVDQALCIGCKKCASACPYAIPQFAADGKMTKCDLCAERLEYGLEPVCARACPLGVIRFNPVLSAF